MLAPLAPPGWFLCVLGLPRGVSRWFPAYYGKNPQNMEKNPQNMETTHKNGLFWHILAYFDLFWMEDNFVQNASAVRMV